MSDKLLPCPLCATDAYHFFWEGRGYDKPHEFGCNNDDCDIHIFACTEERGRAAWNTRVPDPAMVELIEFAQYVAALLEEIEPYVRHHIDIDGTGEALEVAVEKAKGATDA